MKRTKRLQPELDSDGHGQVSVKGYTVEPGALSDMGQLLLEDVCSELVRFLHSRGDPARYGAVLIDREWPLGPTSAFADLRVEPEGEAPYFLEVKYGFDSSSLLAHMRWKYGTLAEADRSANRLVLVVDTAAHRDWPDLEARLRAGLPPPLALEVWDEERLQRLIGECFGQRIDSFAGPELVTVRERIDQGKEQIAFGDPSPAGYSEGLLRQSLLWHFGAWRLAELRYADDGAPDVTRLVPPRAYEQVVVLMADLCGFSRYMRDTPDDAVVRQILTNFYAKSRYQLINAGGMLANFVGDQIIGLFGIPDRRPGYVEAAARTALRLLEIGASISHAWQRRIDHVQARRGVHISMAMGRVQLVSMRPMDPARLTPIGDSLDICDRLLPLADQNQIVISNVLRHKLQNSGHGLAALPPFEARNIGLLQPWRLLPRSVAALPAEDAEWLAADADDTLALPHEILPAIFTDDGRERTA